jgi:hypothetical protein
MKKLLISALAIAAAAVIVPISHNNVATGAGPIPDFSALLPDCTTNNWAKPCYFPDSGNTDSGSAWLGECSNSVTNFCYTATVNGQPAPSKFKIVASVGAYKTNTPSESIAGYEAYIHAFALPTGNTLNNDYWGSSDRPGNQGNNGGEIDLSGVTIDGRALKETDVIKVVVKYKTSGLPQYSVVVSEDGTMDFSITGQDMTLTLEGKPARVAIEAASQHITLDPQSTFDPATLAPNKCGLPNMRFVACNVDRAESNPLAFYSRSKSFINSPGADVPGPIWVSTNATYFHFPNVEFDNATKKYVMRVKTGAPHFLADGTTLHTGSFSAFLPNGILTQWGIEKTEEALKAALAISITKDDVSTAATPTFVISDLGVRVKFPRIDYSAPVLAVGQAPAGGAPAPATTAPATTTTTTTTAPKAVVVTKTLRKGASSSLTKLIALKGKGKATWRASGGCRIKGATLVAPAKAGKCTLTLSQAKYLKTPASRRSISITVK